MMINNKESVNYNNVHNNNEQNDFSFSKKINNIINNELINIDNTLGVLKYDHSVKGRNHTI